MNLLDKYGKFKDLYKIQRSIINDFKAGHNLYFNPFNIKIYKLELIF